MIAFARRHGPAVLGLAIATAALRPDGDELRELGAAVVRPAVLPFAWRSLVDAGRTADPVEAFARAQHLMRFLPAWIDGHCAFAYRYALSEEPEVTDERQRGERARVRLELAMAWLESVRPRAGRHELDLLQALAFLPEVASRREPALAALLATSGGAAAMADPWLAEAERRFPTAAVREQRTFFAPTLAAGLLAAGDRSGAIAVLLAAIERGRDVRDQELATVWRQRLQDVVARLRGAPVDLAAVAADARFALLLPHLR